ncbi:hypothetical protein AB0O47_39650 [Streptomyces noursei]|uniref:hypothetical protein n=1 Tax=Streptomyces noursei TaxID=1971 RepID=UPI00344EC136
MGVIETSTKGHTMGTNTRRHEGRYRMGKRNEDGRTPLYIDGSKDPVDFIWSTGHGGRPWTTENTPDFHDRKWKAAERVVDMVDARRAAVERRPVPAAVPEGYRQASWEEIALSGIRRVMVPEETAYVDPAHDGTPDGGPRFVTRWSDPVRLVDVTWLSRVAHHRAEYGDFMNVNMITAGGFRSTHWPEGDHAIALGALVPVDTPLLTVSPSFCAECGADSALYAAGQRVACGPCTARRLGWEIESLPHPHFESPKALYAPGTLVEMRVPRGDGGTDIHTGTVKEWHVRLDGTSTKPIGYEAANVRVSFDVSRYGADNCRASELRKIDALAPKSTEDATMTTISSTASRPDMIRLRFLGSTL